MITAYVAEHSYTYREALGRILGSIRGIRVAGESANGRDALQQIRLLRPDIVIMEFTMPDLSGVEVVRLMRGEYISSIVMMIADRDHPTYREAAIVAGADYFLDKFFESQKIGPILENLVHVMSDANEQISH